jgi:hypothetical protein
MLKARTISVVICVLITSNVQRAAAQDIDKFRKEYPALFARTVRDIDYQCTDYSEENGVWIIVQRYSYTADHTRYIFRIESIQPDGKAVQSRVVLNRDDGLHKLSKRATGDYLYAAQCERDEGVRAVDLHLRLFFSFRDGTLCHDEQGLQTCSLLGKISVPNIQHKFSHSDGEIVLNWTDPNVPAGVLHRPQKAEARLASNNYAMKSLITYNLAGTRRETTADYRADGELKAVHVVATDRDGKVVARLKTEIETTRNPKLASDAFSLTQFGIPEPGQPAEETWPLPAKIAVGAAGLLLLGGLIGLLRRRRVRAA